MRDFEKYLQQSKAYLHFLNGPSFEGLINRPKDHRQTKEGIWGEAAFTTAMSGYQETITDPSFLGQHIIFSYPHIGNYPADNKTMQSNRLHSTSIIARHFSPNAFLEEIDVPLISQIDTRAIVHYMIHHQQNHLSVITSNPTPPPLEEFRWDKTHCNDLTRVSQKKIQIHRDGPNPIVLINLGCKKAIIDQLDNLNRPLISTPHNITAKEILQLNPSLVFLSNGPGNPKNYIQQVEVVKELLSQKIPLRGICLGHQLIAMALELKTYKLPFGHRGVNHPVLNRISGKVHITCQNHGYAVEKIEPSIKKLPYSNELIFPSYASLFDGSNQGLASSEGLVKSVQFHPEVNPGPHDTFDFFEEVDEYLIKREKSQTTSTVPPLHSPIEFKRNRYKKNIPIKKVLIIGPGPIKIGQASEFDYSGSQACRALIEEGLEVVLVNSNPATIMTDDSMATKTYIEPLNKETLKKIILKEDIKYILSTMGGQTALNLSLELEVDGFLKQHNITLLGARPETIEMTENREIFSKILAKLGYKTGIRRKVQNADDARKVCKDIIGLPLIIRQDFALGGQGSAFISSHEEFEEHLDGPLKYPITLEKSLYGFKEVELEIMIDKEKNGVIICSIENIDPCGVHTGDSITVAPAQTISDRCLQKMRTMALEIGKTVGVVAGGANVQFAINPENEDDITVIEMNPRVSRSSALASKATGYPIAKISSLLALGYTLKEILNDITKSGPVSFEPSLDYVAIKIPLFPFSKFPQSSQVLGPQMRSVGEVLAIGPCFIEAFMKALRSMELNLEIPKLNQISYFKHYENKEDYLKQLESPHELSLLTALELIRLGEPVEKLSQITQISPWFLHQIEYFHSLEQEATQAGPLLLEDETLFKKFKYYGFSDKHLAQLIKTNEKTIFEFRLHHNIFPSYRAVDTCSGEFPALTPYYYSSYNAQNESIPLKKAVMILGSGPNRIGQGIEFDYSCVKACQALEQEQYKSIMINSNPETVSTDYDTSDKLYLSPLCSEDISNIIYHESPEGIISSFSGQTGINLRREIENSYRSNYLSAKFFGPPYKSLEITEDRAQFDQLLDQVKMVKTKSLEVRGEEQLYEALKKLGTPVIVRPSFVIGGESMYVFHSKTDIDRLPAQSKRALFHQSNELLVENFLIDALEYDVDMIRDHEGNCLFTICEHIEYAGVHSGDSGMITPPVKMNSTIMEALEEKTKILAEKLEVIGPINFQFAVKDNNIYCIEANPRGSRTLPFLSKSYQVSLPMIAVKAFLGKSIKNHVNLPIPKVYCAKQSTFPFDRYPLDSSLLGPRMKSTGETMGMDQHKEWALLKSYLGNFPKISGPGKILISIADEHKALIIPSIKKLAMSGRTFYATAGTHKLLEENNIPSVLISKLNSKQNDNTPYILDVIKNDDLCAVFNTPGKECLSNSDGEIIRQNAILNSVPCFTRTENIICIMESLMQSLEKTSTPLCLQELSI